MMTEGDKFKAQLAVSDLPALDLCQFLENRARIASPLLKMAEENHRHNINLLTWEPEAFPHCLAGLQG